MRAFVLTSFDGPSAASVTDVAEPRPQHGEVTVDVEAAGVGIWDVQTTYGGLTAIGGLATFPQVLGWDFSGTVRAIGEGVTDWITGEPVFGYSPSSWPSMLRSSRGGQPTSPRRPRPPSRSLRSPPTSPLRPPPSPPPTVLGAAGGLGTLVVQLARAIGAHVIASDSAAAANTLRRLGVDAVVDRAGDVAAQIRDLGLRPDVLINLVGPVAWTPVLDVLRPGARFVSSVAKGLPGAEGGFAASTLGVQPDARRLAELTAQLAGSQLTIAVTEAVALSAAETALTRVSAGDTNGKLVLDPRR